MPFIGQGRRHWGLSLKEHPKTRLVMGKIGEPNNNLPSNAQGLLQNDIRLFHLLKTLIEHYIVKGVIGVVGQAVIDILMENAQPLGDTFIDGLFVDFNSLSLDMLLADKERQECPVAAAEIQDG